MTVEEIAAELEALKTKWAGHVEYSYSDGPEDWGYSRGMEAAYDYAAGELRDLIKKIKESD